MLKSMSLLTIATALVFPTKLLAPDPEPAPPVQSGAETFEVDAVHSGVIFAIRHLDVGMFYGRFNAFQGTFTIDREDLAGSSVRIEIDAESIDTASEGRDRHLRSPDFFNAKQFPKITFESTEVRPAGDGKMTIAGNLTMLGKTRPVTLEAEKIGEGSDPRGAWRAGFVASATIRRSDFQMNYMLDKKPGLGDEVRLTLAVEGVRK